MSSKAYLASDEISERQYVSTPYQSAWADITRSDRWLVRSLLLTLCSLVPVLNWCICGFAARWGREVCLGINRRLPSSIVDDDTFISGAKIWLVKLCWGLGLALLGYFLLMIPIAGPILVCLLALVYLVATPLFGFQVALSSKLSCGFTGTKRAFMLLYKKPIKTLGSTLSPALVVGLIAGLLNVILGAVFVVLVASSAFGVISNLISEFFSGTDWSTLFTTFLNNFDSIYTVGAYAFFILYFISKFAWVVSNLWIYRSLGHLIARESPEWLDEEELVDTTCLEESDTKPEPYIPLKEVV